LKDCIQNSSFIFKTDLGPGN